MGMASTTAAVVELVGGLARGLGIPRRELDLDDGDEQLPPGRRIGLLDRPPTERASVAHSALRQSQQRQAGLRRVAALCGAVVRRSASSNSPRSRCTSASWYHAPNAPDQSPIRTRSCATRDAAIASDHAPCRQKSAARCAWHWPVNITMSGRSPHQRSSAIVHSWARRTSNARWQVPMTEQYTMPDATGETSPAVTATIASSSSASPVPDRRA